MNDWLHNLPITWMALVVFGFTYLLTAGIYGFVTAGAKGERAHAFKAISPGLLSPLAIIFGLFVAFTAAQVWSDSDRANAAVDREASALRAVVVLAAAFPGEAESRLQALVRRHIEQVTTQEWPMMARGTMSKRAIRVRIDNLALVCLNLAEARQTRPQRRLVKKLPSKGPPAKGMRPSG